MKNKNVFKIGFFSILVFIVIAAYFWYLYFHDGMGKILENQKGIELINNGNINYVNAQIGDSRLIIPVYYFRVKNNLNTPFKYILKLKEVSPSEVNDGCSSATIFLKNELRYELTLDNKVIKSGILSDLGKELNSTSINGNSIQDYALRIWLNDNATNIDSKHYHYVVELEES